MRDIYTLKDNYKRYEHVSSTLVIEGKVEAPEYTIFIPTFKRASTLEISVNSAINQMGDHNYEIVVINNDPEGTTGDTPDLLRSLNSDRVYYYVNSANIGMCGNWNRGIELARGKYISMIHDDDMLSPYFMNAMTKAIADNNNPGIIGVDSITFNSSNMPEFTDPAPLGYREVTKESFFFGKYITIAGMTVRKDLILKLGGYEDEYYPNEDTILIYQGVINDKVINIDCKLAGYRQEVNESLKDETMIKIISIMEETRRNIAKNEPFAKAWMDKYDKLYLYDYIKGANAHWGLNIAFEPILQNFGLDTRKPNKITMKLMHMDYKKQLKKYGIVM